MNRKGRIATNKVWDLRERKCRDDFIRIGTLFNYLIKSVMKCGVTL